MILDGNVNEVTSLQDPFLLQSYHVSRGNWPNCNYILFLIHEVYHVFLWISDDLHQLMFQWRRRGNNNNKVKINKKLLKVVTRKVSTFSKKDKKEYFTEDRKCFNETSNSRSI